MYNIDKFGKSASIITPKTDKNISSLNIEQMKEELGKQGVLLFRGFNLDIDGYSKFTQSLCKKVTVDPARRFVSANAQLVDAGYDAISLHCENGLTPFIPDVLLFMCEIPAAQGSETTYCDGQLVWEHLSPKAQNYFQSHLFYFSRVIPKELWIRYVANEFGITDLTQITGQLVTQISSNLPQHQFELLENGDLATKINVKLVHPTFFSEKLSFANSLIGPSINYQTPIVRDDTGEPIPKEFSDEFQLISDQITEDVLWKKHDMLVIDNTRYMHGRRKIEDKNRKIYAALGYL